MKISAETLYLRQRLGDWGAISTLANAGFDCIDYTMDYMVRDDAELNQPNYRDYALRLREYGEKLGVKFNQAHAPFEFDWSEETLQKVAIPRTIRSLEIASIMGIDTVIVHPLHYMNYAHNQEKVWEMNMDFYRILLPYAQEYNVRIALENLFQFDSRGVAMPDTCSDPERYIRAIDAFNDPHIVACVDVGHSNLVGDDPADLIRRLGHDRLKALHIHDNDAVLDRHTLPFLGKISWDEIAKALAEIHYDGVFTFETFFFYSRFPDDLLPTVACWVKEMGRYLTAQIKKYQESERT